jgi:hypothetical protein
MRLLNNTLVFNSTEDFIKFTSSRKDEISYFIFNKIKSAIELDLNQATLFKINQSNLNMIIKLRENEWIKPLEKCLLLFESNEEYEKCQECLKMIKGIKEKLLV